jgi:hypothetical protein
MEVARVGETIEVEEVAKKLEKLVGEEDRTCFFYTDML